MSVTLKSTKIFCDKTGDGEKKGKILTKIRQFQRDKYCVPIIL